MHSRSDSRLTVSIVMPCLNEIETVAHCVREAKRTIAKARLRGEVVVADSGSSDGSRQAAVRAGARLVTVHVPGYGAALRKGIASAKGELILMGDSDRSYDFSELPRLLKLLRSNCDIVLGSRLKGKIARGAMPLTHRVLGTPLLNLLLRLFFGIRVSDSQSGMRAFSKLTYQRLKVRSTGMEFASEMLIRAARLGLRIGEVPIRYRKDGRPHPSHLRPIRDGLRHLKLILHLVLAK